MGGIGIVTVASEGSHAAVSTYLLLFSCVLVIPGTIIKIYGNAGSPTAYIDDCAIIKKRRGMASFDGDLSASEIARQLEAVEHRTASSETVTSCRSDPPADLPGLMPDGCDESIA